MEEATAVELQSLHVRKSKRRVKQFIILQKQLTLNKSDYYEEAGHSTCRTSHKTQHRYCPTSIHQFEAHGAWCLVQ